MLLKDVHWSHSKAVISTESKERILLAAPILPFPVLYNASTTAFVSDLANFNLIRNKTL